MKIGRNDGSERALSVVVDEARRMAEPDLDWSALEAKLERAVPQPAPAASPRRIPTLALALIPAAAIAAAIALLATPRVEPAQPPFATVSRIAPVQNGDSLSAEELIIADAKAVEVVHAGRARWTLEPNSRALVLDHGDVLRVRLVAGAMKAEVVPSPTPERFVVEAAGTRVAVHGTVFRVQLRGERTLVDVEQGVVSVGPREKPAQATALLRAPAHAEFTLEGTNGSPERSTRVASRRLLVARPHPSANPAPSAEPSAPEAAPEAASPSHSLTIGEAEAGVAIAVAAITRCFQEHTEGSHNVQVTAQTELTLDVSESGIVTDMRFAPPLSPLVQSCGRRETLAVRFAPSSEGARITRVLELTR